VKQIHKNGNKYYKERMNIEIQYFWCIGNAKQGLGQKCIKS